MADRDRADVGRLLKDLADGEEAEEVVGACIPDEQPSFLEELLLEMFHENSITAISVRSTLISIICTSFCDTTVLFLRYDLYMEEQQPNPEAPDEDTRRGGLLTAGLAGGLALGGCAPVAIGLTDGHEVVETAIWASIVAGFLCLGRSAIHVLWGHYLTWRPSAYAEKRFERTELNLLVPGNVVLSAFWIRSGFSHLHDRSLDTPLLPSLALFVLVVVVAMETVRCARRTGKRRGTEIVCEGPVGTWFRDFFTTTDEGTGFVHRVMVFLRNPNASKSVSRFLMLMAAIILIPCWVHASAAAGNRLHQIVFGPTPRETTGDSSVASGGSQEKSAGGESRGSGGAGGEAAAEDGEDECAVAYDGEPAPSPYREQLAGLFHAEGAEAAGCPNPARAVDGQQDVWYAKGFCGSELRSLAVTAPEYLPAILYQQAAEFADGRAADGVLLGASSRWPFRAGDLYVVNTTSGSYVLVRRRSSTGAVEAQGGSGSCDSYTTGNLPYTILPPGLVRLWLELVESEWVWPQSAGRDGEAREFEFLHDYPDDEVVATASCPTEQWCTLSVGGEERQTAGWAYTSVPEIEGLAERSG